jgi:dihydrodipicolinate synthase/N-acetylneuraminate lyase
MVISPFYYPPRDQEVVYDFYKMLSDNIDIGILLYNNFEVTNIDVSIDILKRLKELKNIVGMKECTPNFYKMGRVAQEIGDKVSVVNGHGEFLEPFAAIAGTTGFISSMANFAPHWAVEIWKARSTGDYAKAKEVRDRLIPYMDLAIEYSQLGGEAKVIALLKYATDIIGSVGGYGRLPVRALNEAEKVRIRTIFTKMGLIK